MPSRLLSVEEAAAYLNVSPRWIRSAVFEQRFATVRLGRCVRIETDELDRYVEANRQPARRELDRVEEVVAIRRRTERNTRPGSTSRATEQIIGEQVEHTNRTL